jgi:hypothetical protein
MIKNNLLSIQQNNNIKYNLVFFFSEGSPKDDGLNLLHNIIPLFENAKQHFDNISFYTPTILRKMGYDYFIKKREKGLVTKNNGLTSVGNGSWKPLIMLLELAKMNDGDILVYRDSNILKYPNLGNYDNIKNIINYCLTNNNFDFFVPREIDHPDLKLKYFTKTNIIRELGDNHSFCYNFPLCLCGLLTIAKKSKVSIELLDEWKKGCEKEEWIDGKIYSNLHNEFAWSTPEQSILCVILSNWVRTKKYNIPSTYPTITFKSRDINDYNIITDYDYLKYL